MSNLSRLREASVGIAILACAACATTKPVAYSGLASSSQLRANTSDESGRIPYAYLTDVTWRAYDNVIVDPVTIYNGADNQFEKIQESDKQTLARYMEEQFSNSLSQRFKLVNTALPRTLRVRLSLTGAKRTPQVVGTVTKIDLMGGPYNVVQGIRGKEGAFGGSVSYAVEIYDAATNELLSAFVEKQYPNAMNMKASFGALAASKADIRKGAEELAERFN